MQRRGADARVQIEGILLACQRITVRINQPLINTSNTEGEAGSADSDAALGSVSKLPDIPDGEVEFVSATFNDTTNPFDDPIALGPGFFYNVQVWPAGLEGPSYGPWSMAFAGSEHSFVVPGGQPVSLRFQSDAVPPDQLTCLFA